MTSQDAEQLMNPFYPNDPNLAIKAMGKALEGYVPEWILETIVRIYFTFRHIQELEDIAAKLMMLRKPYTDPFGLNTVPYRLDTDHGIGRS